MASKQHGGVSFDDLIQADRKKRGQALADQMFSKTGSGVQASRNKVLTGPGATLAARLGVTKSVAKRSASASGSPKPSLHRQWTHDLHQLNNPRSSGRGGLPRTHSASHIERGNRLYANLQREKAVNGSISVNTLVPHEDENVSSLNVRGKAASGPFVVMLSNFAPGTTAADIEAVVRPPGPSMRSCRLMSAHPTVIAEAVFADRSDAEAVIATFNNQIADGRKLHVYMKAGGPSNIINKSGSQPSRTASTVKAMEDQPQGSRYTYEELGSAQVLGVDRNDEAMDVDERDGRLSQGDDYPEYDRFEPDRDRRGPPQHRYNRNKFGDTRSWNRDERDYRSNRRYDGHYGRR